MIIENSPFHISKNKVSAVKENTGPKNQQLLNDKKVNEPGKDDFSFGIGLEGWSTLSKTFQL